jgi:Ca2+-binding RTX toxin-like protein
MAYEVNNLTYPYSSVCSVWVFYTAADYNDALAGGPYAPVGVHGSGVYIDENNVLTASHVVYDAINDRTPYAIFVTPGYDGSPEVGSGVESSNYYVGPVTRVAYFNNFDPNGDNQVIKGDNNAATYAGAELDVAVISFDQTLSGPDPVPLTWGTGFTQGVLKLTGYPGTGTANPMETTTTVVNDPVDNSLKFTGETLGPGSSGGPVWTYYNGVPFVLGVISTGSAAAELTAHASWIRDYVRMDDDQVVGTGVDDIFRPFAREFFINKIPGFSSSVPTDYIVQGGGSSPFLCYDINGGGGVDTMALPWNSTTSQFNTPALYQQGPFPGNIITTASPWMVTWSKDINGVVSGYILQDSFSCSFASVERLAFSNVVYDLTTSVVGTQYSLGPLAAATVVTSLDSSAPNPVVFSIQSAAGDDNANHLVCSQEIDYAYGLGGSDIIIGLTGDDQLHGGDGDDALEGSEGADILDGGEGIDTAVYANGVWIEIDLLSPGDNTGDAAGDTYFSIENLRGSGFLGGDNFANALTGGNSFDALSGRDGADTLTGGLRSDILLGGLGADTFNFDLAAETKKGAGRDEIRDFSQAEGDHIDLSDIDAKSKTKLVDDDFRFIGMKSFHHKAGELHYIKKAGFLIVEGDTNGDGKADFQIEVRGTPKLTRNDFIGVITPATLQIATHDHHSPTAAPLEDFGSLWGERGG